MQPIVEIIDDQTTLSDADANRPDDQDSLAKESRAASSDKDGNVASAIIDISQMCNKRVQTFSVSSSFEQSINSESSDVGSTGIDVAGPFNADSVDTFQILVNQ